MRFVISRRVRHLMSITLAGVLLAGCGSSLGQPGAAAIVGDSSIPLSSVRSWYDTVLRKEAGLKPQLQQRGQMDELGRQLVSFTVQQELVEQAARKEGLSVDEQKITEAIDNRGGVQTATARSLNTPQTLRGSIRMEMLAEELGRKYLDRTSVRFDYTQANTRREAQAKARRMAQGAAETAAVLAEDRKAGKPVFTNREVHAAESMDLASGTPLFGAPVGTVLAFETQPQTSQWLVVRIKDRNTNNPAPSGSAEQVDQRLLQTFGLRLLGVTTDQSEVRLNPRYGVWDPVALAAAPNENETMGFWFSGPEDAAS